MEVLDEFVLWLKRYRETSPCQWWLVLFLTSWVVLSAILYVLDDDPWAARGELHHADDPSEKQYGQDHGYNCWYRGINNRWYHAYHNPTKGINLTWSDNNSTSWNKTEVIAFGWEGSSDVRLRGMAVSSNNRTHMIFTCTDVSGYSTYQLWLVYNTTNQTTWTEVNIDSNNAGAYLYCDIAVNDTDKVLVTYVYNSDTIKYVLFNAITDSLGSPTAWATYQNAQPRCTANSTGKFWVGFVYWNGVNYVLRHRDLNKVTSWVDHTLGSTLTYTLDSMWAFPNDRLGYGYRGDYLTTDFIYYAYGKTSISSRELKQTGSLYGQNPVGGHCDETNTAYVIVYDLTGDNVVQWHAHWNATEGTWQGSEETLQSESSSDQIFPGEGCSGLWPIYPDGQFSCTPEEGYAHQWTWKDEVGDPDDYYWSLKWNATWNWYDWSPEEPEEPPTEDAEGEGVNAFICGGPYILVWAVLIFVVIVFVGVMGLAGDPL